MKATGTLVFFPKHATPRKPKSNDKEKPEPTSTVTEWIRRGFTFPGKPAPIPPPVPPKPVPGPIQVPPTPDNPPRKPGEKGDS